MMDCIVCKGKVEQRLTTYTQWYEGKLIVIENVPAWVCTQCGETMYDPDTVDRIQKLIWSDAQPVRTIQAPVYDLEVS